ncbi:PREDICTED: protein phosphatase 1 regulatory subunit 3E [Colobus angolensis palliatus]|uniref:protein phosphatase 1 regulatory subunit 3E n=1 Tax=Colobus angolensis palliatus TaxID=336983 RepID=UPI0005F43121|nr:PREDICTED: protein phosphatase 1 regulatory subunit 3E [Colobus angolensis palliatus]
MAALKTQHWWQGAPSWGLSSSRPAWSSGKGRGRSEPGGEGQGSGSGLGMAGVAALGLGPCPQRSTSCVAESMFNDCPPGKPRAKGFLPTPSVFAVPPSAAKRPNSSLTPTSASLQPRPPARLGISRVRPLPGSGPFPGPLTQCSLCGLGFSQASRRQDLDHKQFLPVESPPPGAAAKTSGATCQRAVGGGTRAERALEPEEGGKGSHRGEAKQREVVDPGGDCKESTQWRGAAEADPATSAPTRGGRERGREGSAVALRAGPAGEGAAMSRERPPGTDIPRNLSFIAALTERAYYRSQRPSLEEEPEEEPGEGGTRFGARSRAHAPSRGPPRADRFAFRLPAPPIGGALVFALRYRVTGHEFWDNNGGRDYALRGPEHPGSGGVPEPQGWIHFI